MDNQKKYKKSKILNGVLGGALALTLAGGIALLGVVSNGFKNWDNIKPPAQEEPNTPEDNSSNGEASIEEGESAGIRLMAAKIPVEEYAAYGVSVQAESAYTVTATVYPADAANKKVDWSVAFANASSTWANGKKVTDYVTVTPSSDGALTAVVQNIAAFGEQIIVKTTSRDNTSAYATLNVEYLQRTTGYTFSIDGKTCTVSKQTTSMQAAGPTTGDIDYSKVFTAYPNSILSQTAATEITVNKSTVYTRANTDKAEYFTIKPTAKFKTAITDAGLSSSALKEYSGNASVTLSDWFDKSWGSALYTSNAQKNKLISAICNFEGLAYEIVVYTADGGSQLATFGIVFDTSVIVGQKGVESVKTDKTELVF